MRQAVKNGRESLRGTEEAVCGPRSRAAKIASRGIRTTGDVKNLGLALAEDILGGELSHKIAGPVVRSVTLTIRTAEFESRNGNGGTIDLGDSGCGEEPDPLVSREQELLEELEAVRKERAAR